MGGFVEHWRYKDPQAKDPRSFVQFSHVLAEREEVLVGVEQDVSTLSKPVPCETDGFGHSTQLGPLWAGTDGREKTPRRCMRLGQVSMR